ncbi:hypothetical protein GCM10017688_58010 [Streptomyces ramulosus]
MAEMLTLPWASIWVGIIIACRRPLQTRSKRVRKGAYPSTGPSGAAPSGQIPWTRRASPSVSSRSGAKVARASRTPMVGAVPKALARISPLPRNASAQATAQISARVASLMPAAPLRGGPARGGVRRR